MNLPLHFYHIEQKAKMGDFSHYTVPMFYAEGTISEHHRTRKVASFFDISHMGLISVPLNQDLSSCLPTPLSFSDGPPGSMRYTLLLNEENKILDDLILLRRTEDYLLIVNGSEKEKDFSYLTQKGLQPKFIENKVILALQGPQAREKLSHVFPDVVKLKFMNFLTKDDILISCSGYTGEDGFELILSQEKALALIEQIQVPFAGFAARDSLRLEAGLCLYGQDITSEHTPTCAGLSWAVNKPIPSTSPFKRVGLKSAEKRIARKGALLYNKHNEQIGVVTSGAYSPTLACAIAMGYVRKNVETNVYAQVSPQTLTCFSLTPLPFITPNYFR